MGENRKCFVPSCKNTSLTTPEKFFVRVRDDLREEWCRMVNTEYFKGYLQFCCEDHIDPEQDLTNKYFKHRKKQPRLKPSAKLRYIPGRILEQKIQLPKLVHKVVQLEEDLENYNKWIAGAKPRLKLGATLKNYLMNRTDNVAHTSTSSAAPDIESCHSIPDAQLDPPSAELLKYLLQAETQTETHNKNTSIPHNTSTSQLTSSQSSEIEEDTENYIEYRIKRQMKQKATLRLKKGILPHKFECQKDTAQLTQRSKGYTKRILGVFENDLSIPRCNRSAHKNISLKKKYLNATTSHTLKHTESIGEKNIFAGAGYSSTSCRPKSRKKTAAPKPPPPSQSTSSRSTKSAKNKPAGPSTTCKSGEGSKETLRHRTANLGTNTLNDVQDLLITTEEVLRQCRFCSNYSRNCANICTDDGDSANNYVTMVFNEVSVIVDLNSKILPNTVCRNCDRSLQEMCKFVNEVYEAQRSLLRQYNKEKEEIEEVVVKIESEDPLEESVEIGDCSQTMVEELEELEELVLKQEYEDPLEESIEIGGCSQAEDFEVIVKEECEDTPEESLEDADYNENKGVIDSVTETELVPQTVVIKKRKVNEPKLKGRGEPLKKYKVTVKKENSDLVIVKEECNSVNVRNNLNYESDSNDSDSVGLAEYLVKKGS